MAIPDLRWHVRGQNLARELPVVAQRANGTGGLYFSRQFLTPTPPAEVEDCIPRHLLEEKNLASYF